MFSIRCNKPALFCTQMTGSTTNMDPFIYHPLTNPSATSCNMISVQQTPTESLKNTFLRSNCWCAVSLKPRPRNHKSFSTKLRREVLVPFIPPGLFVSETSFHGNPKCRYFLKEFIKTQSWTQQDGTRSKPPANLRERWGHVTFKI